MIILPGEGGEYGVTAGHSPIISQLKPGVVSVIHTGVTFFYQSKYLSIF
jgi:F0F1-type ATP synthase epsilon subunit